MYLLRLVVTLSSLTMILGDEELVGVDEGDHLGEAEVWTDHF